MQIYNHTQFRNKGNKHVHEVQAYKRTIENKLLGVKYKKQTSAYYKEHRDNMQ